MKKVGSTNWTRATTNVMEAFEGLRSAFMAGKVAWIEKRENKHLSHDGKEGCAFPIMTENEGLNNPFNWTMLYGSVYPDDKYKDFKNETEKDLFNNWIVLYSTKEARKAYIEKGEVIEGLNKGVGIATPVRIEDANKTRTDGYKYKGKTIHWKPQGYEYRVVDESIKEVYVVMISEERALEDKEIITKLKEALESLESL